MIIDAFLFASEELAQAALDNMNQQEGVPVDPEAVTQSITDVRVTDAGQVYILADSKTSKYLTGAVQIEI